MYYVQNRSNCAIDGLHIKIIDQTAYGSVSASCLAIYKYMFIMAYLELPKNNGQKQWPKPSAFFRYSSSVMKAPVQL